MTAPEKINFSGFGSLSGISGISPSVAKLLSFSSCEVFVGIVVSDGKAPTSSAEGTHVFDLAPTSSAVYVGLVGCFAHDGTVGSVSSDSGTFCIRSVIDTCFSVLLLLTNTLSASCTSCIVSTVVIFFVFKVPAIYSPPFDLLSVRKLSLSLLSELSIVKKVSSLLITPDNKELSGNLIHESDVLSKICLLPSDITYARDPYWHCFDDDVSSICNSPVL